MPDDQTPVMLAQVVAEDTATWEGWHVTFHWHRIGGALVPAGVDVRSFTTGEQGRGYRLGVDQPRVIRRDTLRHLPFGDLLAASRERVAARLAEQVDVLGAFGAEVDVDVLAVETPDPAEAESPADANYRLTAQVYARFDRLDPREAARLTWEELERRGVTDRRGQAPSRGLVRRWVSEARRRGYLPPAD